MQSHPWKCRSGIPLMPYLAPRFATKAAKLGGSMFSRDMNGENLRRLCLTNDKFVLNTLPFHYIIHYLSII
jgi:hypothetical protein